VHCRHNVPRQCLLAPESTNDNSVAILLTYGTARVLLAGDAEGREEEYMASGPYTGSLTVVKV
jgi:competence protein ComEC